MDSKPAAPVQRFVCIHGHFYQPPRENPWLESIPQQPSAAPFSNWNERIESECFGPNRHSPILGSGDRVARILNNYSHISFNFGPTLLNWLQESAPETYADILEADRESARNFSGHGSALAQAYNHVILPLASRRDKEIQVVWGIRDFERHFGRYPEGLWLPETAVDLETLEVLAEHGIRFTILAPHQAGRVPSPEEASEDAPPPVLDTRRPYRCLLPSGREIALFFYNGELSRAVAFESLLQDGKRLAQLLLNQLSESPSRAELSHIATDGETYGHHHPQGEMALAFAIQTIQGDPSARITNYGEFLELFPPAEEIEIVEDTSWSCSHGIGRWKENCGCNTGYNSSWTQEWRKGLRESLEDLATKCRELFDLKAPALWKDPEAAVDRYIDVCPDRNPAQRDAFLAEHGAPDLSVESRIGAFRLLEMRRQCQLMFTSCGWFFDEVSGIEPVQILHYAARAVELARRLGCELEEPLLFLLAQVESNLPEKGNAAQIYREMVLPSACDLGCVAGHAALLELFGVWSERLFPAYRMNFLDLKRSERETESVLAGELEVETIRTSRRGRYSFFARYTPGQNCRALLQALGTEDSADDWHWQLLTAVAQGNPPDFAGALLTGRGVFEFDFDELMEDSRFAILAAIGEQIRQLEIKRFQGFLNDQQETLDLFTRARVPLPHPLPSVVEGVLRDEVSQLVDLGGIRLLRDRMLQAYSWGVDFSLDGWHAFLATQLLSCAQSGLPLEQRLEELAQGLRLVLEVGIQMDKRPLQRWLYHQSRELAPETVEEDLRARLHDVADLLVVALPGGLA